jgi:hypothetical protein
VAEQQREIEMERMKRQGKKVNMSIREYCTMCDLHFFGNLIVHRKNDRHQVLLSFRVVCYCQWLLIIALKIKWMCSW